MTIETKPLQFTLNGELTVPPVRGEETDGHHWHYKLEGDLVTCLECEAIREPFGTEDLAEAAGEEPRAFLKDGFLLVEAEYRDLADGVALDLVESYLRTCGGLAARWWRLDYHGLDGNLPGPRLVHEG